MLLEGRPCVFSSSRATVAFLPRLPAAPRRNGPRRRARAGWRRPTLRVSHSATCCSSASPAGWPRLSLMFLNRSRSIRNRASLCPPLAALRMYCASPLEKQAAVGEPGEHVVVGEVVEPFLLLDVVDRETRCRRPARSAASFPRSSKKPASSEYSASTPTASSATSSGKIAIDGCRGSRIPRRARHRRRSVSLTTTAFFRPSRARWHGFGCGGVAGRHAVPERGEDCVFRPPMRPGRSCIALRSTMPIQAMRKLRRPRPRSGTLRGTVRRGRARARSAN